MSGYEVTRNALERFARVLEDQGTELGKVSKALDGATVDRDAFGKLPAAGDVYSRYHEHASAEQQNMSDAASGLPEIGRALRKSSSAYGEAEDSVSTASSDVGKDV